MATPAPSSYSCVSGGQINAGRRVAVLLRTHIANGIWTWFTDPRAYYHNGHTYVGWVNSAGDTGVSKIRHSDWTTESFTLHAGLQADDHNNVAVLRRQDGRILTMYSKHNDYDGIRYRVSDNPDDISSFGAEVVLSAGVDLPVTYANLFYLSQSARTYAYFRSNANPICMLESTDYGSTWSAPIPFIVQSGGRPYSRWCTNGVNRVDFVTTNTHPNEGATSIYHFYGLLNEAGALKYYKSDGTLLGDNVNTANCTRIYDGSTTDSWTWGITYGADARPRVLFTIYPGNTGDVIKRMFSRWTGSEWTTPVQIGGDDSYLYNAERNYSGGICFDSQNPDVVYLTDKVNGVREIHEYRTTDDGATWTKSREITAESAGVLNARPYSPLGHDGSLRVLFWSGMYTSFTVYSTSIKGSR